MLVSCVKEHNQKSVHENSLFQTNHIPVKSRCLDLLINLQKKKKKKRCIFAIMGDCV